MNIRRYIATSNDPRIRLLKRAYASVRYFSLPIPGVCVRPLLAVYVGVRSVVYFLRRVLIVEPVIRAYCSRCGKGMRADVHLPWVQGKGVLILGDHVVIDGGIGISFAARFSDHPTLQVGNETGIGHGCSFTVGKEITIGNYCRIAAGVSMFDSSGHPTDPAARQAGLPATESEVRPIRIEDNVWIGSRAMIFPGVTIGQGSVVSAGAIVMSDVSPNTVVAGNPARKVAALTPAGG